MDMSKISKKLDSKDKTKEQLWQEAFDRMLKVKAIHGIRVWYIKEREFKPEREVAIYLADWDLPGHINPSTLISYQPLTRKERRAAIVKVMGLQYASRVVKSKINNNGK
jgi:hypothetical protein